MTAATQAESKSLKLAAMAAYVRCRRAEVLINLSERDPSGDTFRAMVAAAFEKQGIKMPSMMGGRT